MLKVSDGLIVNGQQQPVRLKGFGIGGWLNSENFINGYPGFETGLKMALRRELGAKRATFLWERMLDYFLSEDDIRFIKECGANVIRLPLNYRYFENDEQPFQYLEAGFARLNQVIEWCARHQLYVILDLHAVPGWQDPDWHSDNYGRIVLLWHQRQFQDRLVALWEEFARRYQGNPTIAGYNVINEPVTGVPFGFFGLRYEPDWQALNQLYRRIVAAIRKIDAEHIIFLEGDLFSVLFSGLEPPFAENLVYSSHNYIKPCFGPGPYPGEFQGEFWDRTKILNHFQEQEGTLFARRYQVPLWVGEFGGAFDGPAEELACRLQALNDQLAGFEQHQAHWTIWTYKDLGMMGVVSVAPDSEYRQVLAPVLKLKAELAVDTWGPRTRPTPVQAKLAELGDLILSYLPETGVDAGRFKFYLEQSTLSSYLATFLQPLWARSFRDLTENDIDRIMQSFAFARCRVNEQLKALLSQYLRG